MKRVHRITLKDGTILTKEHLAQLLQFANDKHFVVKYIFDRYIDIFCVVPNCELRHN